MILVTPIGISSDKVKEEEKNKVGKLFNIITPMHPLENSSTVWLINSIKPK